jgi:hypothetical protein
VAVSNEGRNAASRARDAMKDHPVLASGVLAGLAGGVAMMAFLAIAAVAAGLSPAQPLADVGESLVGTAATGAAAKVALGAILQLATSVAFAVVFAGVAPRDYTLGCAMGLGTGVALLAMGLMMSLVVPWVNPDFRAAIHVMGGSWVVAHAVYGVTIGTAVPLRRWISGEASEAAPARPIVPGRAAPAATSTRAR